VEEIGRQNAHEAGAGDKLDVVVAQASVELGIELGPAGEALWSIARSMTPASRASREAGRVRPVGDDER
jgi:hypothetical protein